MHPPGHPKIFDSSNDSDNLPVQGPMKGSQNGHMKKRPIQGTTNGPLNMFGESIGALSFKQIHRGPKAGVAIHTTTLR